MKGIPLTGFTVLTCFVPDNYDRKPYIMPGYFLGIDL